MLLGSLPACLRLQLFNTLDLAIAQPRRNFELQNVVRPGGAAAQVAFSDILHGEAEIGQELLGLSMDALAVLQRAGQ